MKRFVDLLRIYNIDSELVRFGCNSDGGYVLPITLIDDSEVVYIYGVGSDISFETDLLKYKEMECHFFDHTVNELPLVENDSKLKFTKEGLSFSKTECTDNFLRHVERNKHEDKKILLKIDVEGAEYEFFNKSNIDDFNNVMGIILELHWIEDNLDKARVILDKINTKFVLTHAHGNNFGGVFLNEDQILPDTLELTFANRYVYSHKAIENITLPLGNLDFPCNKDVLDYLMVIPDAKLDKDYYRKWVDVFRSKIANLEWSISEKDKHYLSLLDFFNTKENELTLLNAALANERSAREQEHIEAIKQINALNEWTASADIYAKSKVEEVEQLHVALAKKVEEVEQLHVALAKVEHDLAGYQAHWVFRYLKHP